MNLKEMKRKYRRILWWCLGVCLMAMGTLIYHTARESVPDEDQSCEKSGCGLGAYV